MSLRTDPLAAHVVPSVAANEPQPAPAAASAAVLPPASPHSESDSDTNVMRVRMFRDNATDTEGSESDGSAVLRVRRLPVASAAVATPAAAPNVSAPVAAPAAQSPHYDTATDVSGNDSDGSVGVVRVRRLPHESGVAATAASAAVPAAAQITAAARAVPQSPQYDTATDVSDNERDGSVPIVRVRVLPDVAGSRAPAAAPLAPAQAVAAVPQSPHYDTATDISDAEDVIRVRARSESVVPAPAMAAARPRSGSVTSLSSQGSEDEGVVRVRLHSESIGGKERLATVSLSVPPVPVPEVDDGAARVDAVAKGAMADVIASSDDEADPDEVKALPRPLSARVSWGTKALVSLAALVVAVIVLIFIYHIMKVKTVSMVGSEPASSPFLPAPAPTPAVVPTTATIPPLAVPPAGFPTPAGAIPVPKGSSGVGNVIGNYALNIGYSRQS